ncbi:hypothetical protein D3C78_882490 [compost metagenome]
MRLDETDQLDVLLLGLGAEDAQAVFDQRVEVELHVVQFNLSGLEFGNVENFVDQCQQFVAGAVDGLHVVALLDRQRRAQQQLGHAQYAVHGRADLVADLGQELGLGIDLGVAGGQLAAGAEAFFTDAPQTLADREVEQQATDAGQPKEYEQQPLGWRAGQAKQGRQHHQAADIEHQHGHGEQPRRGVALVPVVAGHQQHGQAAQGHQRVGHQVQRQGIDEQQQQAAERDDKHFHLQQAAQARLFAGREEAQGEGQAGQRCQQGGEVGRRCLRRMPEAPPGAAEVEQNQRAEQHQRMVDRQGQAGAGA